ncbi:MAG: pyridoxamine 5'-phosphate oxidase family protein [Tepidisphaeraceae bacterium]
MAYEFNQGERALQDRFDTRRLADRVAQLTSDTIGDGDRDFIERMDMFFLATVDANGNVDCGYKGGEPGFVRVIDERTVAFPWYDGNGQYMGAGNILSMGKVAMLFIDFEHARRMRVNGTATIDFEDPLASEFHEAQFVVRVHTEEVFPNCPRYIHKMQLVERSQFVPHVECETPDPDWKDYFEEDLPERDQQRRAAKRADAPAGSDR